jgi:hypothetical protein
VDIIGPRRSERGSGEIAVFSRARWCFRQCAWPARRHARKKHWRARESAAMEGTRGWGKSIEDLRFEIRKLRFEIEISGLFVTGMSG